MALGDEYMIFHGIRVHIKVVEPEDELRHRVFVMPSPITSAFSWRKITPELSQLGCMTVIMDMPGFGESACGKGLPPDREVCARIAWGVLDEMDYAMGYPPSPWHICGHGSACQTVLEMANQCPDSVCSQIYISPVMEGTGLPAIRGSREKWFETNIKDKGGFARLMEKIFGRQVDAYILDSMRRPFMRPGAEESFVRMLAQKGRPEPFRGFAPVMAVWGGLDGAMGSKAIAALRELAPEAETHVLKTAGGIPMETHSHALRDFLRGWLRYVE